jgi:membrane protein required for colicin V production
MNSLDIFLCIGLVFGLINGLRKGFFVELASLVSILLGIYIAIKFSYLMKTFLENHGFENGKTMSVIAFALTFIAVIIGVSLLSKFFTSLADFASLGWINKFFGGVFGLLKTILILSVMFNLLQKINFDYTFISKETLDKSKLYEPVQKVSQKIYPTITDWFEVFKSETYEMKKPEE